MNYLLYLLSYSFVENDWQLQIKFYIKSMKFRINLEVIVAC